MKTSKFFRCVFVLLFLSLNVWAGDSIIGISVGPAVGFDGDFNNGNNKTALHLNVGLDAAYELPCYQGGFCNGLFVEAYFDMTMDGTYDFGSTQLSSNGSVGNFSEKVKYYSGGLSLRKHLSDKGKITPVIGLGLGFSYVSLSDLSFKDALGNDLVLDVSTTSTNFEITPSAGFSYKLSHKLVIDFIPRLHLLVPAFFNNSYLEFPLGLKYNF